MINFQLFRECVLTGNTPNRRFLTSGWSFGGPTLEGKEDSDQDLDKNEVLDFLLSLFIIS